MFPWLPDKAHEALFERGAMVVLHTRGWRLGGSLGRRDPAEEDFCWSGKGEVNTPFKRPLLTIVKNGFHQKPVDLLTPKGLCASSHEHRKPSSGRRTSSHLLDGPPSPWPRVKTSTNLGGEAGGFLWVVQRAPPTLPAPQLNLKNHLLEAPSISQCASCPR
ncbi:hypothetical protein E2320_005748, partial [Naja naja]